MKTFLLMAALLAANMALASDWVVVPDSYRTGKQVITYDRASIVRTDGVVRVWVQIALHESFKVEDISFDSTKSQWLIRCRTREASVGYMSVWLGAAKMYATTADPSPWRPILPDSLGEYLFETLCRGAS